VKYFALAALLAGCVLHQVGSAEKPAEIDISVAALPFGERVEADFDPTHEGAEILIVTVKADRKLSEVCCLTSRGSKKVEVPCCVEKVMALPIRGADCSALVCLGRRSAGTATWDNVMSVITLKAGCLQNQFCHEESCYELDGIFHIIEIVPDSISREDAESSHVEVFFKTVEKHCALVGSVLIPIEPEVASTVRHYRFDGHKLHEMDVE
jgi:hypothetical protein